MLAMLTYFLTSCLARLTHKHKRALYHSHTTLANVHILIPWKKKHAKQITFYEVQAFTTTKNMQAGIQTNHATLSVFEEHDLSEIITNFKYHLGTIIF